MSFKAKLEVAGKKYNVLSVGYGLAQETDPTGRPSSQTRGGKIEIVVESTGDTDLFWETKRETAFQVFTGATVDESGLLKVKIDWSKMKEKKFRTVYAKIKSQKNGEILYDAKADMSKATIMLFNIPLILTEAGYKSAVMVGGSSVANNGTCVCKEYELIWGNKVSCEFRKKVVEIAKRLGKDPNLLMAAMALETNRTFLPTAGKGTSYVGLIQFGDDAAESVGTTRDALLKMAALEQLDYVEKYLSKKKDKLVTLTDFYLSILMPVDVGKGSSPDHIVFDNEYLLEYKKDGKTLTDLSKSRHYGYRQNSAFHLEDGEKQKVKKGGGKKYDGAGKTYIWEIEKFVSYIYNEGKALKASAFLCNKDTVPKPNTDLGTWNIVITEKYTGKKCTHEKVRDNCRRGKIEVFDHNKKLVLTIFDCLLEGWKGENRMIIDNDTPFGLYKINSTPFIMGSATGEDRLKFGPNPRLAFEPVKGSGDEADKSGRSLIRIHGGRQEQKKTYTEIADAELKRSSGCIRVFDADAKSFYDWWVEYHKTNPTIKPGKVTITK